MSGNGTTCQPGTSVACDSWFHGFYPGTTSGFLGNFMQIMDGNIGFLAGDGRYKVRITALAQPQISVSETPPYPCYSRNGGAQNPIYTQMNFFVGIRDITKVGSTYSIGPVYQQRLTNNLAVGQSQVIDFSALRNRGGNIVGHSVDVSNVKSNSQSPFGLISSNSCWQADLEVSIDSSTDF